METTLDRFGRIVIPKEIREGLGIEAGSVLRVEEREDEIRLTPLRDSPPTRVKGGLLVFAGEPAGDLLDSVKRHRDERAKRLAGFRRRS
jgi:AbrB family looped-hinge helix DNA binding protein